MVKSQDQKSVEKRNKAILKMKQDGYNKTQIGLEFGLSPRQVGRVLEAYRENGRFSRKKGSGRKTVITRSLSRRILNALKKNPYQSCATLKANLKTSVSVKTISNYLHSIGWTYKKATKIPKLDQNHKDNRVTFALEHRSYDWTRVIFSDECSFYLNQVCYGWAPKGQRIPQESLVYNQKVQVFGAISYEGKICLETFEGTMKAKDYVDILSHRLLPAAQEYFEDQWEFQQDNATSHTAFYTKSFFKKERIKTLNWPARSPDLNPIENLWSVLKRRVYARNPKGTMELEEYINEEWEKIPDRTVRSLVESMDDRIEMLIESEGEAIDY